MAGGGATTTPRALGEAAVLAWAPVSPWQEVEWEEGRQEED